MEQKLPESSDLEAIARERRRERWKQDLALGKLLRVDDPRAFAELAACCTEDGDPLTVAEAIARFDEYERKTGGDLS
jgi:hypothetical protein